MEHASLIFQSKNARIQIDPIQASTMIPNWPNLTIRSDDQDRVDAVLISHSHTDHWHLPSIFERVRNAKTPVIVPFVPNESILCPQDFAKTLKSFGQTALNPKWGQTIRIKDIEIDILPFYGEQPSSKFTAAGNQIRSWGNCFRINTPDYSAFVLVDSGMDGMGSMDEVIQESVKKRGNADVVLSCLRTFSAPFFGGLQFYWTALKFNELRKLYKLYTSDKLPAVTNGPRGAARLAELAGAKYFLPYAHGFEGFGKSISDISWGVGDVSETNATKKILNFNKEVLIPQWNCGDFFDFQKGKVINK